MLNNCKPLRSTPLPPTRWKTKHVYVPSSPRHGNLRRTRECGESRPSCFTPPRSLPSIPTAYCASPSPPFVPLGEKISGKQNPFPSETSRVVKDQTVSPGDLTWTSTVSLLRKNIFCIGECNIALTISANSVFFYKKQIICPSRRRSEDSCLWICRWRRKRRTWPSFQSTEF